MVLRALWATLTLVSSLLLVRPHSIVSAFEREAVALTFEVGERTSQYSVRVKPDGADPWIMEHERRLYYLHTTGDSITLWSGSSMEELTRAAPSVIWRPSANHPEAAHNIWAPEIHHLDGRWYIYFAADDGRNENHRMFVLESSRGPYGPYNFAGKLAPEGEDFWAIDGTPFEMGGKRYFMWSGWPGKENGRQNLYVARMKNPWTLEGPRAMVSTPSLTWESWINEGPQILRRDESLFVVFSANKSWTDDYQLGLLELSGNDPMVGDAWRKSSKPVFSSVEKDGTGIYGPGHCAFLPGTETGGPWILYHVAKQRGSGWDREVRAQRWHWGPNGPEFGEPRPLYPLSRRDVSLASQFLHRLKG